MTPKERVKAALRHQEPDRVPMGENEIDAPIIEAVLGRPTYYGAKFRLMQAYLEGRRDEAVDSMKRDYIEFLRKTEHDIAKIMLVPDKDAEFYPLKQVSAENYEDENGNVFRYSAETQELIHIRHGRGPVKLVSSRQEPGKLYEPSESELEFAKYVLDELGETHFIIAPAWVGPPPMPHRGTSYFDAMLEAIIERPQIYRDQRVRAAQNIARAAEYYKARGCNAVMGGEDLGHNKGTLMSPDCFRDILLPGLQAQVEQAHSKGMPFFFHSCGNNRAIWGYFAQSGLDAYQAIQDEEPLEDLKREVGHKLTLWGGTSCRLLDLGTPEQIREQTRRSIQTAAAGGGFILGSSHSLGVGVKYDNYMAMLETWKQCRP
jgi:hypothetical protein